MSREWCFKDHNMMLQSSGTVQWDWWIGVSIFTGKQGEGRQLGRKRGKDWFCKFASAVSPESTDVTTLQFAEGTVSTFAIGRGYSPFAEGTVSTFAGEGTDTLCEDNHPQNLDGIGVFSLVCSDKEILLAWYNILIVEVEDSGIGVDCRLYIQPLPIDDGNVWLLRDYLT